MKSPNLSLAWTEAQTKEFLRKVMGAPVRVLEGEEYAQVRTLVALMEPDSIDISNQRSVTETFKIGNSMYQVHSFGDGEDPIIELMLEDK